MHAYQVEFCALSILISKRIYAAETVILAEIFSPLCTACSSAAHNPHNDILSTACRFRCLAGRSAIKDAGITLQRLSMEIGGQKITTSVHPIGTTTGSRSHCVITKTHLRTIRATRSQRQGYGHRVGTSSRSSKYGVIASGLSPATQTQSGSPSRPLAVSPTSSTQPATPSTGCVRRSNTRRPSGWS